MAKRFPLPGSREFFWGGIGMLLAHLFAGVAGIFWSFDYTAYDVNNENDVIKLHDIVSSNKHRIESEIGCAFMWFAFPFFMIELYLWSKYAKCVAEGYCEVLPYLLEKSKLMWILIICIMIPALILVIVSYDWEFNETGPIPSGYYIQLAFVIFWSEIIDCIAVAEAVFMISYFLLIRFMMYKSFKGVKQYQELITVLSPKICKCQGLYAISAVLCVIVLFILFLIVLFQFGKNGFFAFDSFTKYLLLFPYILRVLFGFRFIWISYPKQYTKLKRIFTDIEMEALNSTDMDSQGYKMDTITKGNDIDNDDVL